MHCPVCFTDITAWIEKYRKQPKVYLDKLYFDENKVPCKEDEQGYFVSGERFAEECMKTKDKCPRCGQNTVEDVEDVQWGPI